MNGEAGRARFPAPAAPEIRFRFCAGVGVEPGGDGRVVLRSAADRLILNKPSPGQAAVIAAMIGDGATDIWLCDLIAAADGAKAIPWVYLLMTQAGRRGLVEAALCTSGGPIATLQPFSRNFSLSMRALPVSPIRLCRFAYIRRLDASLVLESPLAYARLLLHDPRAAAVLAALAEARAPGAVATTAKLDGSSEWLQPFLTLLVRHGFAEVIEPAGTTARSDAEAEAQWEFHDRLFHGRSRAGRHLYPWGATYSWEGTHQPLPAVKAVDGDAIPLFRPDLAALGRDDPPFAAVLERRRSRRIPGPTPLTKDQLGELLYRTCRVRGRTRTDHEEVSNRPYPGGGADYELEIYPVVHRVEGLAQGLYHYDPLHHALRIASDSAPERTALLRDAAQKARLTTFPDVLLCVTARFQRLSYKYSSIAYAVMLKDVGVLYQTLYLAATAMDLAPCALGGGDAELFSRAAGISASVEPSVGEFMVSTASAADQVAPILPMTARLQGSG